MSKIQEIRFIFHEVFWAVPAKPNLLVLEIVTSLCSLEDLFLKIIYKNKVFYMSPGKSAYWKTVFFISHPKHMFWVLKTHVKIDG